ncbi:hypothetical protein ACH49O_41190 [Streptomyces coeruleorubidus]|uniref:hypothetical protein n=1 Tax=Streptomyces coeruleorubidus TaxID=116188 RepID=UPI0033C442C9
MLRKFGLHISYGFLLLFLFGDGAAFTVTAIYDLFHLGSTDLLLSILLRLIVGPLNLAAFIKTLRHPYRSEHYAPAPTPPSIPVTGHASTDSRLALFAQAASIPLLFIPIWIEVQSPIHGGFDTLFVTLAILAFTYATVLITFCLVRGVVGFGWVAVGALLPLAGVAQFVYVNVYKPTHDRPSVDVTAELKKLDTFEGIAHMQATITIHNHGLATADVLGSMYAVTGHRLNQSGEAQGILDGNQPDREHLGEHVSTLRAENLLPVGQGIAQGEKWSKSFTFDTREASQDTLRLTVHISLLTHAGDTLNCKLNKAKNMCIFEFPKRGLARYHLGDCPSVRTYVKSPSGEPPYIQTKYFAQKKEQHVESVESINLAARDQFTQTITEYRMDW